MLAYTITTGLNQHLSDTVSTVTVIFACWSQSREEHVRMMYGLDVNRKKRRWWRSAHVQRLTFLRNALHLNVFITWFSLWSQIRVWVSGIVGNNEPLNQSYPEPETWGLRHTYMGTFLHMQPSWQKVMTPPLSVWAAAAIDRWPGSAIYSKGSFNSPAPLCDLQ